MKPARHWLLWIRWLAMMAAILVIFYITGSSASPSWLHWVGLVVLVALVITYKPLKQRVELSSGGSTEILTFWMNMAGQLRMRIGKPPHSTEVKLGGYSLRAVWFEPTITLAGRPQTLMLFFSYPNGFAVSYRVHEPPFVITRNEVCL